MDKFILYILESSICLIIFYWGFILSLKKDTFFQLNRLYLILSILISQIIPLIDIVTPNKVNPDTVSIMLNTVVMGTNASKLTISQNITNENWVNIIYITGIIIFTMVFLVRLVKVIYTILKAEKLVINEKKILVIAGEFPPCSFFNKIIINRKLLDSQELDRIITHEEIHINQYHTLDVIIINLISILHWFNPIVFFYQKSISEIHEYIADKGSIKQGITKKEYQNLIVNNSFPGEMYSLTNNFNKSLILKRLNMLHRIPSKKLSLLKIGIILPAISIMLIFFSCKKEIVLNPQTIRSGSGLDENGKEVSPDVYPTPEGGWKSVTSYLSKNLVMPEAAKAAKLNGIVNVQFTVMPDGSLSNVHAVNAKNADSDWSNKLGMGCDEEAVRLVKNSPKWKPGLYKGKPIKVEQEICVLFGKQEVWNAKNPPSIIFDQRVDDDKKIDSIPIDFKFDALSPTFPGGLTKLQEFMNKNLEYPPDQIENNITGTVYAKFLIESDGSIRDIEIEKGINEAFNKEAIRVIKLMPKWVMSPEDLEKNEKFMRRTKITIPIKFKL